jgi:hypothetical protein
MTYKNFFLQDLYCDDTSDDEDILPIQSLDSSSTVNNTNQERNNVYSTCILIDLVDGKIQTCDLFSEYLNDTTIPHRTRAIETHKEIMWNLVNHLLLKQQ